MNVLITGGAGYIGNTLCEILLKDKRVNKVVVYDNLSRKNYNLLIGKTYVNHEKLRFVNEDILNSRTLKPFLEDADLVYHLAAKVTTPYASEDAHVYEQVNHWGTAELVYALEKMPLTYLVYLSSLSVYGSTEDKVTEQSMINPKSFYGISKKRGEDHVMRLVKKNQASIIRSGNVYGYNDSVRFDAVINRFMIKANFEEKLTINGDGNQYRSFISVENLSKAMLYYLNENPESGTYNLADKNLSINDVYKVIKEIYPNVETIYINQHMQLQHIKTDLNLAFNKLQQVDSTDLKEDLLEFKKNFAF